MESRLGAAAERLAQLVAGPEQPLTVRAAGVVELALLRIRPVLANAVFRQPPRYLLLGPLPNVLRRHARRQEQRGR